MLLPESADKFDERRDAALQLVHYPYDYRRCDHIELCRSWFSHLALFYFNRSPQYTPFHRLVTLRNIAAHFAADEPGRIVLEWLQDGSIVMVDGGAHVSKASLGATAQGVLDDLSAMVARWTFGADLVDQLSRMDSSEDRNNRLVGFSPFTDCSTTVFTKLLSSDQRGTLCLLALAFVVLCHLGPALTACSAR